MNLTVPEPHVEQLLTEPKQVAQMGLQASHVLLTEFAMVEL